MYVLRKSVLLEKQFVNLIFKTCQNSLFGFLSGGLGKKSREIASLFFVLADITSVRLLSDSNWNPFW
ncbi:hypothetical protein BFAG_02250 [Bacteroides fragilis 3_1_12]|uniref:Transposase n=1 Tax=Bacteroides fragilis 3_1_12 TaxID=457424 RepID=A0ABN0BKZ3_BACFG|nr:hypothetical protein BFAG_02250 [Bacteroides fragilis 3_1_12]